VVVNEPRDLSAEAAAIARYFNEHAAAFDAYYDRPLQHRFRPGLFRARDAVAKLMREAVRQRVLDIGCGSGRVAETVLAAGADAYVGVDLAPRMLELASRRLQPYGDRVRLLRGDVCEVTLAEEFDVVLAIGVWDYAVSPQRLASRVCSVCSGTVLANFPFKRRLRSLARHVIYRR
jgi:SAM-dependent methyltransferase